ECGLLPRPERAVLRRGALAASHPHRGHPGPADADLDAAQQLSRGLYCWYGAGARIHCAASATSAGRARYRPTIGGATMNRFVMSALLLAPAAAIAASAFDGTWKARMDSVKVTGKPDVFLIAAGPYSCASCDPPVDKLPADGAWH